MCLTCLYFSSLNSTWGPFWIGIMAIGASVKPSLNGMCEFLAGKINSLNQLQYVLKLASSLLGCSSLGLESQDFLGAHFGSGQQMAATTPASQCHHSSLLTHPPSHFPNFLAKRRWQKHFWCFKSTNTEMLPPATTTRPMGKRLRQGLVLLACCSYGNSLG